MPMVSMKMDREEANEESGITSEPREYPYGLTISLDDGSLAKLGLTQPPAVGSVMMITAKVVVTSASSYQDQGGEPETSASLQITDMELSSVSSATDAKSLYPNSSML